MRVNGQQVMQDKSFRKYVLDVVPAANGLYGNKHGQRYNLVKRYI